MKVLGYSALYRSAKHGARSGLACIRAAVTHEEMLLRKLKDKTLSSGGGHPGALTSGGPHPQQKASQWWRCTPGCQESLCCDNCRQELLSTCLLLHPTNLEEVEGREL